MNKVYYIKVYNHKLEVKENRSGLANGLRGLGAEVESMTGTDDVMIEGKKYCPNILVRITATKNLVNKEITEWLLENAAKFSETSHIEIKLNLNVATLVGEVIQIKGATAQLRVI